MGEPIIKVKEGGGILALGIFFTVIFGGACVILGGAFIADGELVDAMIVLGTFGIFALLGLYLIFIYGCHKLQVFSVNQIVYGTYLGTKRTFTFRDIAKVREVNVKNGITLYLFDQNGKKLARVENNMKGYAEFVSWLYAVQADAIANDQSAFEEEPMKISGTGKISRTIFLLIGLVMIFVSVMTILQGTGMIGKDDKEPEAMLAFDPFTYTEEKQFVAFEMISYPFASFELSDAQGLYFVFDEEMYMYIVCMDNALLETEFAEIYEYTFSDALEAPKVGELEGYAMEIDENLKQIAIEEFNYMWNEEIVNEENFTDYFGEYYLDSTYMPGREGQESAAEMLLSALFGLAIGGYLIYYSVTGYKKRAKAVKEAAAPSTEDMVQTPLTTPIAGELPITRNIIVSVLATIVGAAVGGVLWIIFYKLGRIAAIAGYAAVLGAIWGWTKFAKRTLTVKAAVWCIFVGASMIVLANYVSYAWDILDVLNETSQGRAEFMKVLSSMPQLMSEWELWSSFIADLGIGLFLAVVAGLSNILGKKKK